MARVTIYHNPRCSKSRQTLELLQQNGIEAEVVEYLKNPPTKEELLAVLEKLNKSAFDILRKGDLKKGGWEQPESEEELVDLMIANPVLIERPIVVGSKNAAIGRPPENVLEVK